MNPSHPYAPCSTSHVQRTQAGERLVKLVRQRGRELANSIAAQRAA